MVGGHRVVDEEWVTETLTHWTKGNSENSYFTQTTYYLGTLRLEILAHLSYSPDFPSYCFHSFRKIKERLQRKCFTDAEEAATPYVKAVEALNASGQRVSLNLLLRDTRGPSLYVAPTARSSSKENSTNTRSVSPERDAVDIPEPCHRQRIPRVHKALPGRTNL
ncbi:hypothetical protein EVAR_17369_1 [Eumeta japonica]|uniref:Uncharacterized protein n=1 Tax=Eumeta variegata TaxID=151549 RepID=A0A4C1WFH6_EUMVA|nr:hypothetical protein EVAR_17369_1 [Eumeta japonica]